VVHNVSTWVLQASSGPSEALLGNDLQARQIDGTGTGDPLGSCRADHARCTGCLRFVAEVLDEPGRLALRLQEKLLFGQIEVAFATRNV
jgi:hypothetical protein